MSNQTNTVITQPKRLIAYLIIMCFLSTHDIYGVWASWGKRTSIAHHKAQKPFIKRGISHSDAKGWSSLSQLDYGRKPMYKQAFWRTYTLLGFAGTGALAMYCYPTKSTIKAQPSTAYSLPLYAIDRHKLQHRWQARDTLDRCIKALLSAMKPPITTTMAITEPQVPFTALEANETKSEKTTASKRPSTSLMRVKEIIDFIEMHAPVAYQDAGDGSGLVVGDKTQPLTGILCGLYGSIDLLKEATEKKCNCIILREPLIEDSLRCIDLTTDIGGCLAYAIKHDLVIYVLHTNLDNVFAHSVNTLLARRLGLTNVQPLSLRKDTHSVLTTFVPIAEADNLREALTEAGAGKIGNYSGSSFTSKGTGRFLPNQGANPTIGEVGKCEQVAEERVEMVVPKHLQHQVVQALIKAHCYETPAYYLQPLDNSVDDIGHGSVGWLPEPLPTRDFLLQLKTSCDLSTLHYTKGKEMIHKVAFYTGRNQAVSSYALAQKVDAFVTTHKDYDPFLHAHSNMVFVAMEPHRCEEHALQYVTSWLEQSFASLPIYSAKTSQRAIYQTF